jgi:hypothetical protein
MKRVLRIAALVASVGFLVGPSDLGAQDELEAEPAPVAPTPQEAMRRGVDFLVASQNPNGSWGGPTNTKGINIYAPVPGAHHAFRAGTTGLAIAGIAKSNDERPEVLAALAKAETWLFDELPKLRRADPTTTYNVWGHAYGLRALTALALRHPAGEARTRYRDAAQQQIEMLSRYSDINGGWGYLHLDLPTKQPSGMPTSFTTATVLLAMHEAREALGVKLDEPVVARALRGIETQKNPDFSYAYAFPHRMRPRAPINRPAGSLARSQACNAALRTFNAKAVPDEVLRVWLTRFLEREGFLSIARKRPIPHDIHFSISGYFYYYGIFYFTESLAHLPKTERPAYAASLATLIASRQESDGSWWDYPLYDYHKPYGTGYALLALAACRE